METNRTKTNPQSGFDAQVGALLDRIHESASIVDSLMAMPVSSEGDAAPDASDDAPSNDAGPDASDAAADQTESDSPADVEPDQG